jgi:hypothetical protein
VNRIVMSEQFVSNIFETLKELLSRCLCLHRTRLSSFFDPRSGSRLILYSGLKKLLNQTFY